MTDPNIRNFETRLQRIDQIHAAGGAFEAAGALGRSYYTSVQHRPRRSIPWRGLAFVFTGALLFKGALLAQMGEAAYSARVASLAAGGLADQLGAWVLRADPVTQQIAATLRPLIY